MGQRFDGGGEQRAVGGGHGKAGIGSHFADEGRGGPEERFELGGLVGSHGHQQAAGGFAVKGFRERERADDRNAVQRQMRAKTSADAHFSQRHGKAAVGEVMAGRDEAAVDGLMELPVAGEGGLGIHAGTVLQAMPS